MKKQKLSRIIVAFILVLALVAPSLLALKPQKVEAGIMTDASLTISDSRAAQTAVTYDFAMSATDSASLIKQVDIVFCTNAVGVCSAPSGFDVDPGDNGFTASSTIAGAGGGETWTQPGNNSARVVITTPAAEDPVAFTMQITGVTNPTASTSLYARVTTYSDTGTTVIDTVQVATAIISQYGLAVTGEVGPVFTFTITGTTSGGTVNSNTTNVTTTDLSIPFGGLSSGVPKIAAHELAISTNATNGYMVTVESTAVPPLVDGTNNIDSFAGAPNDLPITWDAPTAEEPNANTGFFGYTTEDAVLSTGDGLADRFTSNKWAGFTTDPEEVFYSATPPTGEATTNVGWQAEVNNFQPAGAYTGTVVLIATPTY